MAAPPPWNPTQLQERAVLGLGARHALEAIGTPWKSPPPWSKPLLTSNQPWAQKRNAATTANPTQSGQWVRPMQIIRLSQLDGADPPGASPWRESRQFCTSPSAFGPLLQTPRSSQIRQQGRRSAPAGSAGLAQAPPGQQEP